MSENIESNDSAQNLSDCFAEGDRATLEGTFSTAVDKYEAALAILGQQNDFDFEKTRDCLNKLISVHSHLNNTEKVRILTQRLHQIESTQNVIQLQASAEFFAGRKQHAKAASAYAKAFQIARNIRPLNTLLINDLKSAYDEQKKLSPPTGTESGIEIEMASLPGEPEVENPAVQKNRVMRGVGAQTEEKKKISPLVALDIAKAPIFLLIVAVALLASAGQLFVSADVSFKTPNTEMPEKFAGMSFITCDQQKSLTFKDDQHCVVSSSTDQTLVNYTLISDWTKNWFTLFRGYLRRKEYWLKSQGEDLIDRHSIIYYRPTAPEKTIISRMWFYARCAQDQFKERKSYPSSLDRCKRTYQDFDYINPFTGKSDCASLLTQGLQNAAIDLRSRGLADRQWRPGAILCLQQDTKHFMVQGFDGQGRPFVSSDPTTYFAIALEYGKTLTAEPKSQAELSAKIAARKDLEEDKSAAIYITNDEHVLDMVEALRRLPQIIGWSAFVVALGCFVFANKFKKPDRVKKISTRTIYGSAVALILFYIGAF